MPAKTREVLRLFVMAITDRIICSYNVVVAMPAYCGGDNEVQLSNQLKRLYADLCLCRAVGRQRGRYADRNNFSKFPS